MGQNFLTGNGQPLVSVLMTAYNRQNYISHAIESVLSSTYRNFELIISDDCSLDNTVEIARNYQVNDNRVQVYTNQKNLGDYANRNKAACYAKGKYLKYLDSDDIIYPWGLEAMVYCMEKFPDAAFGLMSYGLAQNTAYPVLVKPEQIYQAFFFKSSLISMGPSGAIFRKNHFEKAGGFSGKPYVGDTEMWLKLGRIYPMVRMPVDLIWWREHAGQQIKEEVKDINQAVIRYMICKEALLHPGCPLSKDESEMAYRNLRSVRVRRIVLDYFLKFKFRKGFAIFKRNNFSLFDLLKALRRNVYGSK
jgi:glycosyltransferase involved in cell wall biosynthesis